MPVTFGSGILDAHPFDRQRPAAPLAFAQVDLRRPVDREHVEHAAGREVVRVACGV